MKVIKDSEKLLNIHPLMIHLMLPPDIYKEYRERLARLNKYKWYTRGIFNFNIVSHSGEVDKVLPDELVDAFERNNLMVRLVDDAEGNHYYAFSNVDIDEQFDDEIKSFVIDVCKRNVSHLEGLLSAGSVSHDSKQRSFQVQKVQKILSLFNNAVTHKYPARKNRILEYDEYYFVEECRSTLLNSSILDSPYMRKIMDVMQNKKGYTDLNIEKAKNVISDFFDSFGDILDMEDGETSDKIIHNILVQMRPQPSISVEIKQMVKKTLKNGKDKKEYGVEFCVNGKKCPVLFGGKERIMVYMCTLLRQKIGERMYLHEFYNNSKGGKCKIKRGASRPWIEAVYYALFPSKDKDFDEWISKIDLPIDDKDRGRPVIVGKTQANSIVKKSLHSMSHAIKDCIINTIDDALLDTYYSINIAPENITVAPELVFLLEYFYDMLNKEKQSRPNVINE